MRLLGLNQKKSIFFFESSLAKCSFYSFLWGYLRLRGLEKRKSEKKQMLLSMLYKSNNTAALWSYQFEKGREGRQEGFLNIVLHGPSGVPYDKKPSIRTFRSCLDPWSGSDSHCTASVDTSTDCTDWLLCHIIPGLSDSLTSGDINTSNRQAELNWLSSEFSLAIDYNGKKKCASELFRMKTYTEEINKAHLILKTN